MPRITRARAQFLTSMTATLGHFSRPVCPTLGNFALTPRPKDSIRPYPLLGEHQVKESLIYKLLEGDIGIARKMLRARKVSLLSNASGEYLTLQAEVAEAQFKVIERLMRDQPEEIRSLANNFMGCYRSLTAQIPPENVKLFSVNGESLLNRLGHALKQAPQPAAA